nr:MULTISPECIES: hypothetical protein [Thalassospira]
MPNINKAGIPVGKLDLSTSLLPSGTIFIRACAASTTPPMVVTANSCTTPSIGARRTY